MLEQLGFGLRFTKFLVSFVPSASLGPLASRHAFLEVLKKRTAVLFDHKVVRFGVGLPHPDIQNDCLYTWGGGFSIALWHTEEAYAKT